MSARVALVTGGTGGIGTAICRRLAAGGHRVATNYRNEERARDWQARMKADGFDFALAKGDVSTPEDAEAMVREVEKQLGPVDILVNNAGITRDGTFHKMTRSEEHTSELQSLMRTSYAVFCLKKKTGTQNNNPTTTDENNIARLPDRIYTETHKYIIKS